MNYIGALAIEGKQFDYHTNERLQKALELKLFEDQKDSIKLTSLVSRVVDKRHAGEDRRRQEPADHATTATARSARPTCSTSWRASSPAAT